MYLNYMGSADNIWDQTAGDDSDETYGDQAVSYTHLYGCI